MCGIVGVVNRDPARPVDEALLTHMRDIMTHRGPDEAGIHVEAGLGIAHRRLSIVGLSTGQQPMTDANEHFRLVFNGEIYNYLEKKAELEAKGYRFRTESDTEVIIYLYAEYGEACVEHLNGMFVFALWDTRTRRLFIARDRLGIKPLYYTRTRDALVFASEIKALLPYPGVESRCNEAAVGEYFLFRAVTGEQTLFAGIHSLLPGHWMSIVDGEVEIQQYWHHQAQPLNPGISRADASERLLELLETAVRDRLMSEVPLGTFCSGGIDSSLVTAIAATQIGQPVNTFSVGFHEADFDETHYARMVSRRYNTQHHELKLDSREYSNLLPGMIELNDEPLNFANSIQIFAISRLAKETVTVVLTGEGADELFLGYPRYQIPRLASMLRRVSLLARPALGILGALSGDQRIDKLRYFLDGDLADIVAANNATARKEAVRLVLDPRYCDDIGDYRRSLLQTMNDSDGLLSYLSLQDQKTYLVSILNRQDKMSMGASIEARVPFLDYRLVEFANSLPQSTRAKGFETKVLVKQAAARYLPDEVIHRRKSGFGIPLAEWFRDADGLGGYAENLLESGGDDEFVDKASLRRIFREHREQGKDHSDLLWTAVNFLGWRNAYGL